MNRLGLLGCMHDLEGVHSLIALKRIVERSLRLGRLSEPILVAGFGKLQARARLQ